MSEFINDVFTRMFSSQTIGGEIWFNRPWG